MQVHLEEPQSPAMRIRVRFFAATRDASGVAALDLEAPDSSSVADVLDRLEALHPRLKAYRECALFAVDGEFVAPSARAGRDLAIMPPVSGGRGMLTRDFLVAPEVESTSAGAVVVFFGHVRPPAVTLHFEAFEELAERELERVRSEAVAKFGLVDCAIRHRIGDVHLGEPIVAVVTSSRHRREAFEAASWVMDELKSRVPIWKKELDADGSSRWVNDVVG